MTSSRERSTRRLLTLAAAALVVVGLGLALVWALRVVSAPEQVETAPDPVAYVVEVGQVESTIALATTFSFPAVGEVRSRTDGVLTSMNFGEGAPNQWADGDVVATIDETPVFIVQGSIPAYRDLVIGLDGGDIRQLEEFLARAEFEVGPVDGKFDAATRAAVREWQKATGQPNTGVVARATVAFVPPDTLVRVAPDLRVGARVADNDLLLEVLTSEPVIEALIDLQQAARIPDRAEVVIGPTNGTTVQGTVSSITATSDPNVVRVNIEASSNVADSVSSLTETVVPGRVIIVPVTIGAVVPLNAIKTTPSGSTIIISSDGTEVEVSVRAQVDGIAVVDGVEEGEKLLLGTASEVGD